MRDMYKLWFYSDMELNEIIEELKIELDFLDFYHSDEDTWEWLESRDRDNYNYFDIAREHNREHPCYDKPCILILKNSGNELCKEEMIRIGGVIARIIRCEVMYGLISYERGGSYTTVVKSRIIHTK